MQQEVPRTRWQRWRPVLLYGIPLGVLEFGLIYVTVTHNYWLSTSNAILIGWLLYLLIPCIAEYRFRPLTRQGGEESSSTGVRVGLAGWAISVSATTVWLIVYLIVYDMTVPPPEQTGPRNLHASPTLELILIVILLLVIYLLSIIGMLLAVGGARIGGVLAMWRAKRLQARGQSANDSAASEQSDSDIRSKII